MYIKCRMFLRSHYLAVSLFIIVLLLSVSSRTFAVVGSPLPAPQFLGGTDLLTCMCKVGGTVQLLGRWSLVDRFSLPCARPVVDR